MDLVFPMAIGFLGAFIQELVHWYSVREKIENKRYQKLIRSRPYWIVTILMVLLSGVGTWAWTHGQDSYSTRDYLLLGAVFPLLLKKAVAALTAKARLELGSDQTRDRGLLNYFHVN